MQYTRTVFIKKYSGTDEAMVLILEGSSDYDTHVRSELGNLIFLRHLLTSRGVEKYATHVQKRFFFPHTYATKKYKYHR